MSPAALIAVVLVIGLSAFFYVLWRVLSAIRMAEVRAQQRLDEESNRIAARRRHAKPGPTKREQEREAIRLRGLSLARDIAVGRISPIGPRITLEQIRAEGSRS